MDLLPHAEANAKRNVSEELAKKLGHAGPPAVP
jgi:hypothetical protein